MQKTFEFTIRRVDYPHRSYMNDWPYYIQSMSQTGERSFEFSRIGETHFHVSAKIPIQYIVEICKKYGYCNYMNGYYFKSEEDAKNIIEELEALLIMNKLSGELL